MQTSGTAYIQKYQKNYKNVSTEPPLMYRAMEQREYGPFSLYRCAPGRGLREGFHA